MICFSLSGRASAHTVTPNQLGARRAERGNSIRGAAHQSCTRPLVPPALTNRLSRAPISIQSSQLAKQANQAKQADLSQNGVQNRAASSMIDFCQFAPLPARSLLWPPFECPSSSALFITLGCRWPGLDKRQVHNPLDAQCAKLAGRLVADSSSHQPPIRSQFVPLAPLHRAPFLAP